MVHKDRIIQYNSIQLRAGPVVYWMSREHRAKDNWALIYAAETAMKRNEALQVVFCLLPKFSGAQAEHYRFMLQGLKETAQELQKLNIGFEILTGDPVNTLPEYVKNAGILITDFDPLLIKRRWKNELVKRISVPFHEVDAHNIVPCRIASEKAEYGAYTIRPKIHRNLVEYLTEFPEIPAPGKKMKQKSIPWDELEKNICAHLENRAAVSISPGTAAGEKQLDDFIDNDLHHYHEISNDPNQDGVSRLSAYLHFGQISAQSAALKITQSDVYEGAKEAFLEQLIVRRELSDNFCYYNSCYQSFEGFPNWAKQTLNDHRNDSREYLYSLEEFEEGVTHDPLWNAAQRQMVSSGYMHGYMRMYWCKKILEWTPAPETAMETAITLNDRYQLDGRDANGYTGIAWSIGGVHDRAWKERPVFGKIRFMNARGAKRKFDTAAYIRRWTGT